MDDHLATRIDDAVGWWHDGAGADLPLHAYLGMDPDEYGHWLRTGELPPTIAQLDEDDLMYWPVAGTCWVCSQAAHYHDMSFVAPVCGAICSWAAWEAMRLHDTPWRAW